MACQLRLFNMGHYFPYGPWPLDFEEWSDFETATRKEIQGTTALGVTLLRGYNAKGDVGIEFNAETWNLRAVQVGDKVVFSNSHPSLDYVFGAPATSTHGASSHWNGNPRGDDCRIAFPSTAPCVHSARPDASERTST